MNHHFVELKSTDNSLVYVRREAVTAFEVVSPTQHVDGHIKLYVAGFKFLIAIEKEELLKKLEGIKL